eukprot:TRINITY_DN121263_c0_g1_i1.p1 TRINITY_DN121263_c0_g1~~TRINITY_DN121263_c0_g1_i1.p1  ORF type:complete len:443 (-),score=84.03 TRINITY_DN121263_c0_g1_i1:335-1663(-)
MTLRMAEHSDCKYSWQTVAQFVLAVVLPLGTCSADAFQLRGGAGERLEFAKYDYLLHGEDWTTGLCFSRMRQSPIDFAIDLEKLAPSGFVSYRYSVLEDAFELKNNARVYYADISTKSGVGGLVHEDVWYDLMSVNFHGLSEHTFFGHHLPMEVHLVHKKYDSDDLLIVAVPVTSPNNPPMGPSVALLQGDLLDNVTSNATATEGPGSLPLQPFLWKPLPAPHESETVSLRSPRTLDLNEFMQSGKFYEYAGSMTGPPCSEQVTWLVRTEPLMAAPAQLQVFLNGIYDMNGGVGNYRAAMPVNGRPIRLFSSMREADVKPGGNIMTAEQLARMGPTPEPLSAAEARGFKLADDTLRYISNVSDFVYDVEGRIHNATRTTTTPTTTPAPPSEDEIQRLKNAVKAAARIAVESATKDIAVAVASAARSGADAAVRPVRVAAALR